MFLKTIFFSLLSYLLLEAIVFSGDRKLKNAMGCSSGSGLKKGLSILGKKPAGYLNPKAVELRLKQAGNPWGLSVDSFIGLKLVLPLLMAAVQFYLGANKYYLAAASCTAFFLPDIFIRLAINDRRKAIKSELPDLVDIFETVMEAGIDVGVAFNFAATYVEGKELKKEVAFLAARYAVTKDKEKALEEFKATVDMYDTDLLALALLQDNATGKAQGMLESLSLSQANNRVALVENEAKAVEYRVLAACSLMAVTAAFIVFYPYFFILNSGLKNMFN